MEGMEKPSVDFGPGFALLAQKDGVSAASEKIRMRNQMRISNFNWKAEIDAS